MSAFEPDARRLAEFDTPVAPRIEFANALRERLLAELVAPAPRPSPARVGSSQRRWTVGLRMPKRRRLLVVAVALMLLLVGVATATLLSVRPWTSSEPRGTQVRSDFRLIPVYRAPRDASMDLFSSQALSGDGHDLYLVRKRSDGSGIAELVRIRGVDTPHPVARRVLDFADLGVPSLAVWPGYDSLAAAPGGDLFAFAVSSMSQPLAAEIVVIHPDHSNQVVLTYDELVRQRLVPRGLPDLADFGTFSIAATGRGTLWLRVAVLHRHIAAGWPYDFTNALIEVVDPNRDGDWRDRVIRRITVPQSVPAFQGRSRSQWMYLSRLEPEPSLPGDDRSRSVLVQGSGLVGFGTANPRQEYRVYRISDFNDDGDALDPKEVQLLYRGTRGGWPGTLAERVVRSGGTTRRELVIAGLSRPDRLTLVPEHGVPVDIARSFPSQLVNVFAGPRGDIYPIYDHDLGAEGAQLRVDRLAKAPADGPLVFQPAPSAVRPPRSGKATLAVTLGLRQASSKTEWRLVDGRVAARAPQVTDVCGAHSGRLVFRSDSAVPQEPYVYVATSGGAPRKLSERDAVPVCPFDGRHVFVATRSDLPDGPAWSLESIDADTGAHRPVIGYTPRFAVAPDGTRIAYVLRADGRESLAMVDATTSRRRVLVGPIPDRSFSPSTSYTGGYDASGGGDDLVWSPDGRRLAVVVGRGFDTAAMSWAKPNAVVPPRSYRVLLVDPSNRSVRTVATIAGGPPTLGWSFDGAKLLVCAAVHGPTTGCGNHYRDSSLGGISAPGSVLRLVDVATGASRVVARGSIMFAGWSPRTDEFAWTDDRALHIVGGGDDVDRSYPVWSTGGDWLGWSPDGNYIAEGPDDHYAVVDAASGKALTPIPPTGSTYSVQSVRWWP